MPPRLVPLGLAARHAAFVLAAAVGTPSLSAEVDYARDVVPILTEYCAGCHNSQDAESGFAADSYAGLIRGGDSGPVIAAGDVGGSRLLRLIAGSEMPKMPPEDEPQMPAEAIEKLTRWVAAGAKGGDVPQPLAVRAMSLGGDAGRRRQEITAAFAVEGVDSRLVVGGNDSLRLIERSSGRTLVPSNAFVGRVTSIRPAGPGRLVIASGLPGVGGRLLLVEGETLRVIAEKDAHADAIYAAACDPSGELLATGGYDRTIRLWKLPDFELIGELQGHNGAVYDLDFDSTGELLCSASSDETVKLWNVRSRQRLDTFGQCEAAQYTCRFAPDGSRVIAGGADRRIRVWQILSRDQPTVNPMVYTAFAHEADVLAIRFSPDGSKLATAGQDSDVKIWSAADVAPLGIAGRTDGVPTSLDWTDGGETVTVTTLRGQTQTFLLPVRATGKHPDVKQPAAEAAIEIADEIAAEVVDVAGNDSPDSAQRIELPSTVHGVIDNDETTGHSVEGESDYYRFAARAGERWVIEVDAQRSGSPLDSRVEVLTSDGSPIVRTRLQALRETYFTFRGKNSSQSGDYRLHRWEDMELNDLIYAGGEVNKLWLHPRGPDSGFLVYPGDGDRWTYYDTTASTHALNEPAYIVRELEADESPTPNGLPVFPIYYENDDDATRRLGKDSRLIFTAPADGEYLVRIRDARRLESPELRYRLQIRAVSPSYKLSSKALTGKLVIGAGSEIEIAAERLDGFGGRIDLQIAGLPAGIRVSEPLFVEAGQTTAVATIFAEEGTVEPGKQLDLRVSGEAEIEGRSVQIEVAEPVVLKVEAKDVLLPEVVSSEDPHQKLEEVIIHPGETVTVRLRLDGKDDGPVSFGNEDCNRNFPHGVIVDNIGLNGLLIPAGETERDVFIKAAPVVVPQERPIHFRIKGEDGLTTRPILLRVLPRE